MGELYVGWQRWEDNKPTDQVMGKAIEGYKPVLRSSLPDKDQEQWEVDADGKERDPYPRNPANRWPIGKAGDRTIKPQRYRRDTL